MRRRAGREAERQVREPRTAASTDRACRAAGAPWQHVARRTREEYADTAFSRIAPAQEPYHVAQQPPPSFYATSAMSPGVLPRRKRAAVTRTRSDTAHEIAGCRTYRGTQRRPVRRSGTAHAAAKEPMRSIEKFETGRPALSAQRRTTGAICSSITPKVKESSRTAIRGRRQHGTKRFTGGCARRG